ncbi:MAG: hypothetical protein KAV87_30125 [Desulfobacteraceae bacterium]|nr:hypothetical protein [Desulfobacteraceae bacterium]
MDLFNELFGKLPKLATKAGLEQEENSGELQKFGKVEAIKLDRYYEFWRSKIRSAATHNQLLSNGWAFSTLGGLSSFERYIRTNKEIRSIYFNKAGEIGITLDKIADQLGRRYGLGGIILYGYGNLFRESYFIEQAKMSGLLQSQRIYLIDCSLFYHIFANSSLNPLRNIVKVKQIRTLLLDYLDGHSSRDALVYARDDLNPTRPVLHLFLGNTFGNIESNLLKRALYNVVRSGDFVIGEYALFSEGGPTDSPDDYVPEMARMAASELFSVAPALVTVRNVNITPESMATEVEFTERDTNQTIVFRSMLRRSFSNAELTDGKYKLVSSESTLSGKIKLDSYIRLSS